MNAKVIKLIGVIAIAIGLVLVAFFLVKNREMLCLMWKNPDEIGAIAESSPSLAHMITKYVPNNMKKRILEVGAGTGVFTAELVKKLGPLDELHVVELMPELCAVLKEKFGANHQVSLYCGDIIDFKSEALFDYIVSGLPFNSFPAELVSNIIAHFINLSVPGASLSFFEYIALPRVRLLFSSADEQDKIKKTRKVIVDFIAKYEVDSAIVLQNIPPARVHFLRIE